MMPWRKEKMVMTSAEWMWWNQKKNEPAIWWSPEDLTSKNPDNSNPQLTFENAQTVFEELKSRGLLRLSSIVFYRERDGKKEDHEMVVYFIQRHKEKSWMSLINKGFIGIYLGSIFNGTKVIVFSVILFLLVAIIGGFLSSVGEDLYNHLKCFLHIK